MLITLIELFDMVLMTLALGFIFEGAFRRFRPNPDDLESYYQRGFNTEAFKTAAMITAPGILLHELAHKFVALSFGLTATFHAAYDWLVVGVVLKLIGSPFLFFVPAFISISPTTPGINALVAFAGPATNGLLWLAATIAIKKNKIKRKHLQVAYVFRYINGFLFVFNMIPIPGFDGSQVLMGLIKSLF